MSRTTQQQRDEVRRRDEAARAHAETRHLEMTQEERDEFEAARARMRQMLSEVSA